MDAEGGDEIEIRSNGLRSITAGLRPLCGYEICAEVVSPDLVAGAENLLRILADYISNGARISDGQTIRHGYWSVRLQTDESGTASLHDFDPATNGFIPGVSAAVTYWNWQTEVCRAAGVPFSPPFLSQLVVVSDDLDDVEAPIDGVRYDSPGAMSGWWITENGYTGPASDLKTVHLYHLTQRRPDLIKFLALPFGYRFQQPENRAFPDPFEDED
jgi:hypothetical protein